MTRTAHRFADFLHDLQQLERASFPADAAKILEAFTRHTPFEIGALYLRGGRDAPMKLAAKSQQCVAPEILDTQNDPAVDPRPAVVVRLRGYREDVGVLALSGRGSDDDLALVRAAADFVSTIMTNQRLLQETREGDFQLKYRLWELESLYDIGLSIASTLNIDELADEILFRMISLTNARRAALFLRDGDRFVLFRSFGDVREDFLDRELAAQLVTEGTPLTFEENTECVFPGCSAFVAVPIKGNNAIIGVLAAADRETREGAVGAFEANELRLLSLFATQAAVALENARLHKEALEKQRMDRELELAATIQRDILPKSIPYADELEIATLSRPARQVGGDYHTFVERDGVMSMLVADVSGKSMPAALLVSALHAAVQLLFAEGRELGDIATELNKHIHRWSAENKFVTMIMVSIDRENDVLEYVNAGHNPAYVMVDGRIDQLKSHGLPIGIMGQTRYMTQRRPFPARSCAVLYSDGITEAENAAGVEFENERLEELMREHIDASPNELRDRIAAAVDNFVGDAPQKDDQTLVIARRL
ncbi:MAG TPA: SpoIIE family protein phosphatase [Thermoanaerobaculia bacterium]|jgi:sigma-B regulation protein RsbU (phosphoserine phosphatase)|nr:SpoIIE family protein phosphatase [Thermoanaerobaculia bacterium]